MHHASTTPQRVFGCSSSVLATGCQTPLQAQPYPGAWKSIASTLWATTVFEDCKKCALPACVNLEHRSQKSSTRAASSTDCLDCEKLGTGALTPHALLHIHSPQRTPQDFQR